MQVLFFIEQISHIQFKKIVFLVINALSILWFIVEHRVKNS